MSRKIGGGKADEERKAGRAARILHLHSSFAPGGKELRCVQLINAFGARAEHAIVSADRNQYGASKAIAKGPRVVYPRSFPSLTGLPTPGRLLKLARKMQDYDLILTYNWGAMDAAMAHTLFAERLKLPPLIHHEDGFNLDEAARLKPARNWYRRIGLGRAAALVVPSTTLGRIARQTWSQPADRVHRIANGIDVAAYRKKPKRTALPRLIKRSGELWIGSMAGLRPIKRLDRLVGALQALPKEWHLVIFGEGPERDALLNQADELHLAHRIHLPGHQADPAKVIGLLDIFALSSDSEQFPVSVLEAMAAGVSVAASDVGDIKAMVSAENVRFIASLDDPMALRNAIRLLADDAAARQTVGKANRAKVAQDFAASRMIDAYRALYNRFLPSDAKL